MTFKEMWQKLFHPAPKDARWAATMNGFAPIYSQFGTNIYASDVVQQALKCIVDELKKLNPRHVRYKGADPVPVKGDLQDVLENPNPLMTTSEFIEKTAWMLLMNYNAFVIPVYSTWRDENTGVTRRKYEALYPIKPEIVNFIQDGAGRLYCEFEFWNGYKTTIPYEDVIHIRLNYANNQYMGGDELGQPNHGPLLETLDLNKQLLHGVAKAMNASYAINGFVKYGTIVASEKLDAAIAEFNEKLANSQSGFVPIDLKAEVVPFERSTALVDEATLKFIDGKILRNFGVPLDVLSGDFSQDTYNSFYQKTLEPIIITMGQAFTKKIFTEREKQFGNKIVFYPKALIFLSIAQTLEMINMLSPTGGLYENEKRTALGLAPLPELEGKRYMSLNWIDANNADQYQIGNVNVDVVDENKTESIMEE